MRHLSLAVAVVIAMATGAAAQNPGAAAPGSGDAGDAGAGGIENEADCASPDLAARISACSAVIEAPDTPDASRAQAYFQRGYAFGVLGDHQREIEDYGDTLRIVPRYAPALNNRASTLQHLGKAAQGLPDIEEALRIAPDEPIYNSTRAEIAQALGDIEGAMRSHETAMELGGADVIRIYQCSLRQARLYQGPLDGIANPEVMTALRQCVDRGAGCAPLPDYMVAECKAPPPTA